MLVIDILNSIETPLAAFTIIYCSPFVGRTARYCSSQSIVVSYKVNSPTRPPTAPAEMFSKQFYHCQEYFLYIFISSWLFYFCAFSKEGIALHYSFLTMHVALLAGGTQVQSCMQYHRAFM